MRALPSGSQVTSFSLATNRTYKDKEGAKKEETEFINAVAFGKQAETIAQWVRKGQILYIDGRLKTQSWEKDGVKHYKTEVVVESFQFGPKAAGSTPTRADREDRGEDTDERRSADIQYPDEEINPEDIPF